MQYLHIATLHYSTHCADKTITQYCIEILLYFCVAVCYNIVSYTEEKEEIVQYGDR